jgi:hypothetical protein
MTIDLVGLGVETIILYDGDNPRDVATEFCHKHDLDD